MRNIFFDDFGPSPIGIIAILLVVFAMFFGIGMLFTAKSCHVRWERTDRAVTWGVFSGCLVESNDQMVPEARVWYERNN